MKVPLKWLAEYVPLTLPVESLARKLTLGAAEVEEIIRTGAWDEKVRVGHVLHVEPHPNADRLRLVTVDLGDRRQRVVCGAPNVATGQRIAFGEEGARLISGKTGESMVLKAAPVRGIVSAGMVLSERELGLSEAHEGILVLPPDAPIGTPLRDYLGETVLNMAAWSNRPDLFSIIGVAREIAALTGAHVREPSIDYPTYGAPADARIRVTIDDPELCPRYTAMLIDHVQVGPSPAWMQERLAAAGMRPINNVVDITNYVMLEYGQPLHAFDATKIGGNQIVVRRARPDERLTTLDGEDRELTAGMLVIADASRPVALAGVMGGLESEVSEQTASVLLESATFYGASVRRTAARLRMRSEASMRFEKGLPPELAPVAARRAVQLLAELAGGQPAPGMVDAYPNPHAPVTFIASAERLHRVLGIDIPAGRALEVLRALGFEVEWQPPDSYAVSVPYWRPDVRIADDIAEELIRIVGYDDLPSTTVHGRTPQAIPQPARDLRERVKDILVEAGMHEIQTYALVSLEQLQRVQPAEELALTPPLRVANPMSAERELLRTSSRGSALEILARNLRVQRGEVALFETSVTYQRREGDLPEERETLTAVIGGRRLDRWGQPSDEPVDFFDAKGYAEALFAHLHLRPSWEVTEEHGLLPGRTAAIRLGGQDVGVIGQVHPDTAAQFDIDSDCLLFEVRMDLLLQHLHTGRDYQPYSTVPAVQQDLAVIVDAATPAHAVRAVILAGKFVTSVRLFDEYRGPGVPEGRKSLAFAVAFQDRERTLTEDEVSGSRRRIIARLERELGAALR